MNKIAGKAHVRIYDIGTKPLTFKTTVKAEDVQKVLMETGRVFRFQFLSWNGDGTAVIRLVPDNGLAPITPVDSHSNDRDHE